METRRRRRSDSSLAKIQRVVDEEEKKVLIRELNSIVDHSNVEELLLDLQTKRRYRNASEAEHSYEKQDAEQVRLHKLWTRINEINSQYKQERTASDKCESVEELEEDGLIHYSDESVEESDDTPIRFLRFHAR